MSNIFFKKRSYRTEEVRMMPISITRAKHDDLEALYNIERECFTLEAFSKKQIASLLKNPNSINLLALMDCEIVGFLIALIYEQETQKIGHIYTLDVAVKARKQGVGLKLLTELEQILREKEVKVCYLEVKVDNSAALRLYRKLGYIKVEFLKGFYSGIDGIRMKKIL